MSETQNVSSFQFGNVQGDRAAEALWMRPATDVFGRVEEGKQEVILGIRPRGANPDTSPESWSKVVVAKVEGRIDNVGFADIDGDGLLDVYIQGDLVSWGWVGTSWTATHSPIRYIFNPDIASIVRYDSDTRARFARDATPAANRVR